MVFRHTVSLISQLRRQVIILSLIAVIGVLGAALGSSLSAMYISQGDMSNVALNAARDFDLYFNGIQNDMRGVGGTWSSVNDQNSVLRNLLKRNPGMLEVTLVDPNGNVVAHRQSNGATTVKRIDNQPWLSTVQAGGMYVSDVDTIKYGGFPVINMAVPYLDSNGDFAGTIVANVDLTTLWDQVKAIKVGHKGYGYLANADGKLLVYSNMEKVQSGLNIKDVTGAKPGDLGQRRLPIVGKISLHKGLKGGWSFSESKELRLAPWYVVTEQTVGDALGDYALMFISLIFLLGVVFVLVYAILRFLRRGVIGPLRDINTGLQVFSSGDLDYRMPTFQTVELSDLATTLNEMASSLKTSQAEIVEMNQTLENRIDERTRDISAVAKVSNQAATILDISRLLQTVCDMTKEDFRLYHAHIYLLDEGGQNLDLTAGAGEVGRTLVASSHRIALGHLNSVVALAARERRAVAVNDVRSTPNFLPNPLLPDTHSELAVALVSRDVLLGVLDVQSDKIDHFSPELVTVMETLAQQIASAMSNARLFSTLEKSSRHDQALSTISQQIQGAVSMEEVLRVTARELGKALRISQTTIELRVQPESPAGDASSLQTN